VQRLQQGTDIFVYTFLDECCTRLCASLSLCVVARLEGKSLCHGSSGFATM
jgi:hypothetical protein